MDPARELTFHFYRAPGEKNDPSDLRDGLRDLGLSPTVRRKNPSIHDVWKFGVDLMVDHGRVIGTGAGLATLFGVWLKETKNRRIEIERPGLKLKVATARDLEKTLTALHDYDELTMTLNGAEPVKRVAKKTAVTKKRKSK